MEIQRAGYILLGEHEPFDASCRSLWPLGIALVEGAALFSLFDSSLEEHETLRSLFNGGEPVGPSIDTRLRCIRDLCSASAYALRDRSLDSAPDILSGCIEPVESPGECHWTNVIARYVGPCDDKHIAELSRLLDDSFEEMIRIASNLRGLSTATSSISRGSWNEIYRAASHIRDHFDYAEDSVLASIHSGNESDPNSDREREK